MTFSLKNKAESFSIGHGLTKEEKTEGLKLQQPGASPQGQSIGESQSERLRLLKRVLKAIDTKQKNATS